MSNIILGMMRINEISAGQLKELFAVAREAGINTFDHADSYVNTPHECEHIFGSVLQLTSSEREEIVLQSKVGIRKNDDGSNGYFDFSRHHIIQSATDSVRALGTDYLDLLLLHRTDTLVEPDEVADAFDYLHSSGLVRNFGVSNHAPQQIELLKSVVRQPLKVDQVQLSVAHASLVSSGLAMNMAGLGQSASRDNGLLDYSRLNGVTLQAWSPFQTGFFGGPFVGDQVNYGPLNEELNRLSDKYGVTPSGMAVAWITRHPANIQVVLGTTNPRRVIDSAAGSDIPLTRQEWYGIFVAAGHTLP
ncbi:aldo/keto reductase [Rhodococcus koreensis]